MNRKTIGEAGTVINLYKQTCSSIEILTVHNNIKLNILSVRVEAHGTLKEGDKPAAERDASISGVMKAFAPSVPAATNIFQ